MRQAIAWSLVGAVFVASLLACPLPAGAGDPDIPLYHTHGSRQSAVQAQGRVDTEAYRTNQGSDSPSTVVNSPAPRIATLWQMLARWMISQAVRAGH